MTWEALGTIPVSRRRTTVIAANGPIETDEAATVFVKDVDMFVTLQLLDDTINCNTLQRNWYPDEWKNVKHQIFPKTAVNTLQIR